MITTWLLFQVVFYILVNPLSYMILHVESPPLDDTWQMVKQVQPQPKDPQRIVDQQALEVVLHSFVSVCFLV